MASTEELEAQILADMESDPEAYADTEIEYCTVDDDTRVVTVPEKYRKLGVESDEAAKRVWFRFPKLVGNNGIDLSAVSVRVNFRNANGDGDIYMVQDLTADGDNVVFSWELSRKVTAYKGSVSFVVCAVKSNTSGVVKNEWNTTLNRECEVLEGLEVSEQITQENPDIIEYILANLGGSVSPEQIAAAVEEYLVGNPPSGMTAEEKAQLQKNTEDISQLSEEIINQAEVDDDGLVSFKNSQGLTLFTLDLSEFSGGGNVYGELVISTESLSINEGESGTFTVKLATAPTINQVVYLAVSDNTKLSVSPSNLTFSPENWGTEQIITVTAEQDDDATDETITVSLTSKKVSGKAVSVLIADDEVENPFIDNMVSLIYSTDVDKENHTYYDTATGENVSWINSGPNTEISAFKNIFSVTSMKVTEAYNRVVESGEFTIILVTDETDEIDSSVLSQHLKVCQYDYCKIYNKFNNTWDNIYTECSMTYINSNGEQSTLSENANTSTVINNLAIKSENWLYAISAITLKKNGEIDWYAGSELIHTTPAPEDFVKWDMSTVTSSWANWRVTVYAAVDHWLILDKAVSGADIRSYYEYLASKAAITSF